MRLNSKKKVQERSKEFVRNKNNINKKKISCKSQWSLHDKHGQSKAEDLW